MKTFAIATSFAVALALGTPAIAEDEPSKGEIKLAKLLEGRVAGEPRSCITMFRSNDLDVIHETAVVFERGDTVWVARPSDPRSLDEDDILVVDRRTSQLCRHDVRRTMDSFGIFTGVVFLSDFVPYRKTEG